MQQVSTQTLILVALAMAIAAGIPALLPRLPLPGGVAWQAGDGHVNDQKSGADTIEPHGQGFAMVVGQSRANDRASCSNSIRYVPGRAYQKTKHFQMLP